MRTELVSTIPASPELQPWKTQDQPVLWIHICVHFYCVSTHILFEKMRKYFVLSLLLLQLLLFEVRSDLFHGQIYSFGKQIPQYCTNNMTCCTHVVCFSLSSVPRSAKFSMLKKTVMLIPPAGLFAEGQNVAKLPLTPVYYCAFFDDYLWGTPVVFSGMECWVEKAEGCTQEELNVVPSFSEPLTFRDYQALLFPSTNVWFNGPKKFVTDYPGVCHFMVCFDLQIMRDAVCGYTPGCEVQEAIKCFRSAEKAEDEAGKFSPQYCRYPNFSNSICDIPSKWQHSQKLQWKLFREKHCHHNEQTDELISPWLQKYKHEFLSNDGQVNWWK